MGESVTNEESDKRESVTHGESVTTRGECDTWDKCGTWDKCVSPNGSAAQNIHSANTQTAQRMLGRGARITYKAACPSADSRTNSLTHN